MSYLTLPDGIPDFSKAVISLWFRVPTSSMNAAIAQAAADPSDPRPRLSGIIPLLTWGPLFEGYKVENNSVVVGSYTETLKSFNGADYVVLGTSTHPYTNLAQSIGASTEINPSLVGVFCQEIDGAVSGLLVVRIQMEDFGSGTWVYIDQPVTIGNKTVLTSAAPPLEGVSAVPLDTAWEYGSDTCLQDEVAPEGAWNVSLGALDITELSATAAGPDAFEFGNYITIEPDKWHHALISIDLSSELVSGKGRRAIYDFPDCTVGDASFDRVTVSDEIVVAITNPARMWIAFDDVDFVEEQGVSGQALAIGGLGNNGVAPQNAYQAAAAVNTAAIHQKAWNVTGCVQMRTESTAFGIPTYDYVPSPVPGNGYPLGIPAAPVLVGRIHPVEMAELQIFTGVTLNTADTDKRRAFVDVEGKPVNPADAETLLGKKPDVLLHGSGNWIAGRNTGPTLPDPITGDPIPDPAEALTPTGKIVAYKPDPSLGGDQGPSPSLRRSQVAPCQ